MILVELCQGEPPYLRENPVKALYLISTQEYPTPKFEIYSKKLLSFIGRCLKKNPKKRGSTYELLEHEFLKNIDDNLCKSEMQEIIKCMRKMLKSKDSNLVNEEQKKEIFL